MPRTITERSFFRYLKCPHWVYFDAHGDVPKPHDPLMQALQDEGLLEAHHRALLATRKDVAEVTAEDEEEAFFQTLAFMREGRQTIYRGVLIDGHWIGHPDILEKVEGKSKLGDYFYVAADMKRARALKDEFMFQGCFYAELLQKIQGTKPVQGYVITPDQEVLSYVISSFEGEYALTLDGIERIVSGEKPVHFLTSGCKQSPWFETCRELSESCDDLSVLNRVWKEEIARLNAIGVRTVAELAKLAPRDLAHRIPEANPERLETLRDQALALVEKKHIIRGRIKFEKVPTELYFDIESNPLRDHDYLFGVLEVTGDQETYHAFFAGTREEEKEMWEKFCSFMESHPEAPVYHYGRFEADVLRRFDHRFGCTPAIRSAFANNLVDVLGLIRPNVLFPLSFYSLKDIAAYIGFHWRAEDAGGANSVLWFEAWLRDRNKKQLDKIVAYNEDDVRATLALVKWLKANAT